MGIWSKIGQTALRAAPYAAAPFTGGASLLATGAANQAANKWADSSANKEYQKTGIAPSRKFDQIANIGGNIASVAGGMGAFGKMGPSLGSGKFGGAGIEIGSDMPSQGGITGNMGKMGKVMGGINAGAGIADLIAGMRAPSGARPQVTPQQTPIGPSEQATNRMSNMTPNLENYISQGHEEALYDQPWRKPYPSSIYGGIGGNRRFQGSYGEGIAPGTY